MYILLFGRPISHALRSPNQKKSKSKSYYSCVLGFVYCHSYIGYFYYYKVVLNDDKDTIARIKIIIKIIKSLFI